jgi:DNA polymerase-3 subunit alpha
LSDLEFDKSVKLDFEREMLGTYISDHPLYEIESLLAAKTDGSIISIRERGDELSRANKVVTVGGILAEVQLRTTKAGQQYARVVLEDLGGSMEIIFSARKFEECSGFLAKDNVVLIEGRLDARDEELRFSALTVTLLRVDRGDGELRLALRPEDLTASSIGTLRDILSHHPGRSPVIVETGEAGKAYKLGPEFNVNISAVVGDLRSEFGRNVIKG